MPSHDFSTIGDVLDFDILRGTIISVDSETDTCEVDVGDSSYEALLFYHCEPDSVIREDNGAIEGAASGFNKDDEVIVMINKDQSVIKVIAHTDGVRHCNEYIVVTVNLMSSSWVTGETLVKKVSLVWNAKNNQIEQGPVDYDDSEFQEWYENHNSAGEEMFSSAASDITSPYKLEPGLTDEDRIYYHDHHPVSSDVFPESTYRIVLLPDSPTEYVGIRTKRDDTETVTSHYSCYLVDNMYYQDMPVDFVGEEPYYLYAAPHNYTAQNRVWTQYGIFGELFSITSSGVYEDGPDHAGPSDNPQWGWLMSKVTLIDYIPPWYPVASRGVDWSDSYWEFKRKLWVSNCFAGQYSNTIIANVCFVQYVTVQENMKDYPGSHAWIAKIDEWTQTGNREIALQAQALYVPEGTNGCDWVSEGRNTEFETQIIAAVNMAYSLNSLSGSDIRDCSISIEIMK